MRILLADDQPKVRFALRVLLERQPGLKVVGEAVDAENLLVRAEATHPDLVLLGWELPGLAAVDSLSALRKICPELFVIALSGRPEARRAALAAGADAFVSKTDPPERLLAAIKDCWAGSTDGVDQTQLKSNPTVYELKDDKFAQDRKHFTFKQLKAVDWKSQVLDGFVMTRVDEKLLARTELKNVDQVTKGVMQAWNSIENFTRRGFGFCLLHDDVIVSWCIADQVAGSECEMGVNTDVDYRERGLATLTVAAAVEYCLENHFEQRGDRRHPGRITCHRP